MGFHLRQKGIQMTSVDKIPPDGANLPSKLKVLKSLSHLIKKSHLRGEDNVNYRYWVQGG